MGSKQQENRIAGLALGFLVLMLMCPQGFSRPTPAIERQSKIASDLAPSGPQLSSWLALERGELFDACATLSRADWQVLSGQILMCFGACNSEPSLRGRLLDLAAQAPRALAEALGEQLWRLDSGSFDLDHQLAFAARGVQGCEAALEAYVTDRQRSLCIQEIGPAVYLALRGEEACKPLLQRAWDWTDLEQGGAGKALLIAYAMEYLDSDGALSEMRLLVAKGEQAARDAGFTDLASQIALEAKAFDLLMRPGGPRIELSELAWFGEKLGRHCLDEGKRGGAS